MGSASAHSAQPATIEAFDATVRETGLLRLITCGSVDDGKSTLIGRLLLDSKGVYQDQLDAIQRASDARGGGVPHGSAALDLALITDGLRAEREQGITIDVAYRYFATPARRFILADTPGHAQYTRNMATGASTADAAVLLIDARQGVIEQTRRHTCIAALLGIRHLIVAVNKMDLVSFDAAVFHRIVEDFLQLARGVAPGGEIAIADLCSIVFAPMSALEGDNVVRRSERMKWYSGPALLEILEGVPEYRETAGTPSRFPVQYVIRPQTSEHHDYRGYAGQVAGGYFAVGDEVIALPGGQRSHITGVHIGRDAVTRCGAGESVSIELADDIDIGRGDMLVPADVNRGDKPIVASTLDATVVWMTTQALTPGKRLVLKHAAKSVVAVARELRERLNMHTMTVESSPPCLALNEIGRVTLKLASPIACDPYTRSRLTGAFILIDEQTNATVGAGMIRAGSHG